MTMTCEALTYDPLHKTFEGLFDLTDEGRRVTLTLYRTRKLSSRSAKAFLGGSDPKLTIPLCDIVISPLGVQVYWRASSPPPERWGARVDRSNFLRGLASFKGSLLTIGDLRII